MVTYNMRLLVVRIDGDLDGVKGPIAILDHVMKVNPCLGMVSGVVQGHATVNHRILPLAWSRSAYLLQQIIFSPCPWN
jgi:hypothetical protein